MTPRRVRYSRDGFAGEMQGGCKPEGGAVAPVAELLSGAGLRVSEHGGDWALLRAGSLLSRGPLSPADLLVCKKPPGQRTRPPHLLAPLTHLQGSVSFWVLPSEEEEESLLQMACGWSGGLCWCSLVFNAGRGPLAWSPAGSLT